MAFVNSSSPIVVNNLFEGNPCRGINFTLPAGNRPSTVNNTIVGNRVGIRVDRRVDSTSQVYANNVLVDNRIGVEVDFGVESNNPVWRNNDVFGNEVDYNGIADQTGMNGNISADPRFRGVENFDFRLSLLSPSVDTGDNLAPGLPETDLDGRLRVLDGDGDERAVVDMGAFEFDPAVAAAEACLTDLAICEAGLAAAQRLELLRQANELLMRENAELRERLAALGPADADLDGVPDRDDRCPSSRPGPVDVDGCSQVQFCDSLSAERSKVAAVTCQQADWLGNGSGQRDCQVTAYRPQITCEARATSVGGADEP